MTADEWIRVAVFAFGTVVVIGSLGEMWYGPRRGMTWGQFLRYTSLTIIVATIMIAQYDHRHLPITGYTISLAVGTFIGSLGVAPQLKRPIRRH